ncbi:hypothetical protein FA246_05210, partial [Pseudomonas aeruginosa]|nr:hypothetical protein [Pseudomonas aeruginosa]
MAVIGRFNSLQVVKHTEFGLYLDGTQHGEILLPRRYAVSYTHLRAHEPL